MQNVFLGRQWLLDEKPPEGFGFIYKLTSPSGKSYIGKTIQSVSSRFNEHCKRRPKSDRYLIHKSINKYKKENIKKEIIGVFLIDLLDLTEITAIKEYNTLVPNGYNLTEGGEGGIPSEEIRQKISKANKGRKITEEHRLNISKSKMGTKHSKEWRENHSRLMSGRKHSEETKLKIAKSHLGMKATDEAKKNMKNAQLEIRKKQRGNI